MKKFRETFLEFEIVQTLSAQLTWSHIKVLPLPQSEHATQTMKDPYIFDFIEYNEDLIEVELKNGKFVPEFAWCH